MSKNKIPRILLMGAGRFGKKHLRVLLELEGEGACEVAGVVVQTKKSQREIDGKYPVPVFTHLSRELLQNVDGVDIATPAPTHFSLVKQVLNHTDVLVEKPLTLTAREASVLGRLEKKNGKAVLVGHIYRFHPMMGKLNTVLRSLGQPYFIRGKYVNPKRDKKDGDILLELLHPFDIVEFLFGIVPQGGLQVRHKNWVSASVVYPEGVKALLDIGYKGGEKIRTLDFYFQNSVIGCDFAQNVIEIIKGRKRRRIACPAGPEPLKAELKTFLKILQKRRHDYPDIAVAKRIIGGIEKIKPHRTRRVPEIAVVGGGIFGAAAAMVLSRFGRVHLFEQHPSLMQEASYVNQYRHHWGYHYPRSFETVKESREARSSFESIFEDAVVHDFPSFYCVSRQDSKISGPNYLQFCQTHSLPFVRCYPPQGFLNRKKISLCLKTAEPVYDYDELKKTVEARLKRCKMLSLHLSSRVDKGFLKPDGKKYLRVTEKGGKYNLSFDFVVNATYARINAFAHWFDFPSKPLRMDLVELVVLRLPVPAMALTIMDGAFPTLVTTGRTGLFTLGHVRHSVRKSFVPPDGLVPQWKLPKSNWKKIVAESKKWFPILRSAEYVESRFVVRAVNAYREHDDARPSDILRHGFGCWSILGGKVITAVAAARSIAKELKQMVDSARISG